jgi:hypothetical protein
MNKAITLLVVALFLSVVIAPAVRAEGLLSDIFNSIKGWFESSPLGNIFTSPVKRTEVIRLGFYPETYEFTPTDFVNVSTNTSGLSNFKGTISVDLKNKISTFKESGSTLLIRESIGEISIDGLKLASIDLKGMKLALFSGNWNETTENGSVTLNDFLGKGTIKEGYIEFEGNASRVNRG